MKAPNTKESLHLIAEALPHGAVTEIAEKCGVSKAYVSQFFSGKYNLTSENEKLLDAANEILDREKSAQKSAETKINEMLSKGKE